MVAKNYIYKEIYLFLLKYKTSCINVLCYIELLCREIICQAVLEKRNF